MKRKLTLNNILYSQGILSILFTHLREKILSAQYARQLVERLSVAVLMLAFNRRAHFRFRNTKDKSNHHPSCDFYDERISPDVKNHLVYFSTDRTKITHVIRKMVCAGIQEGFFDQESTET
ncbi:hypothetical protein LFZ31_26900, partial [Salmonella enterica subsp. enterica serovar Newport str. S09097]